MRLSTTCFSPPSDRIAILLARADAQNAVDVGHPDLAIADHPGAGVLGDGVHHGLHVLVKDDDVQAGLAEQDGPRVDGQVAGGHVRAKGPLGQLPELPPEAAHRGDGEPPAVVADHGVDDFVELLGPDDREQAQLLNSNELIDVLHRSLTLWKKGEADKVTDLLRDTSYGKSDVFYKVAQAISEALPNDNREKKLLEGFLSGKERVVKEVKKDTVT